MGVDDKTAEVAGYVELVGPMLRALGASAGVSEIHDVGAILSAMPLDELVAWFGRMRTDLIQIDAGTMSVGPGVEVEKL